MKIAILGAGSWGTAIANLLSDQEEVSIYCRRPKQAEEINHFSTNSKYFKDFTFQKPIYASSNIKELILSADLVINAIPTQQIRTVAKEMADYYPKTLPLINLSKGLEASTGKRISEIFQEEIEIDNFMVLSGPSHAEELVKFIPTTVVLAGKNEELVKKGQNLFIRPYFRVYTGSDLIGVELGGAVKNVLAIGIGALDGVQMGDNPKAALITRGVHEMVRFGLALGGQVQTLYGLSGLGDLIVTATSKHSRNRMAGELIGKGLTISEVKEKVGQIIEGFFTCSAVYGIAKKYNIDMPITKAIYESVYEEKSFHELVDELMTRSRKQEFEDER